eukprot:scaffold3386_cov59-Phaeocystis_antarctica.AAC.6
MSTPFGVVSEQSAPLPSLRQGLHLMSFAWQARGIVFARRAKRLRGRPGSGTFLPLWTRGRPGGSRLAVRARRTVVAVVGSAQVR